VVQDTITIRSAHPEDAETLARLRYQFRAEVAAPIETEVAFAARTAPWIAARLTATAWRAWVAEDGAAIVGHVFVQFVEKIPNPVPEAEALAYLTNLYTIPPLRNLGIGARLLTAALAACDAMEVETVFLRPSRGSVPLYRRNGFMDAALLERPASTPHTTES
jgi:GNAT superfamily N-acetyltransferase